MSYRCVLMLVSGVLLLGIGAITRTYMNIMISRSPLPGSCAARSTELRYRRLISGRYFPRTVTDAEACWNRDEEQTFKAGVRT
jgi:hypothetical protein